MASRLVAVMVDRVWEHCIEHRTLGRGSSFYAQRWLGAGCQGLETLHEALVFGRGPAIPSCPQVSKAGSTSKWLSSMAPRLAVE